MQKIIILLFLIIYISLASNATAIQYSNCTEAASQGIDMGGKTCINVSECQILSGDNNYYLVTADINASETCFNILTGADDNVLDLNEHVINYAYFDLPEVYNGDFEIQGATPQDADGWDLTTGASNARRISGITPSDQVWNGQHSIAFEATPGIEEFITSTTTLTLQPGVKYMVGGHFYHNLDPSIQIHIELLNVSDDSVIMSTTCERGVGSINPQRGLQFCPWWPQREDDHQFYVSSPTEAYVKIRVTGAGSVGDIYFDYIRVFGSDSRAIETGQNFRNEIKNGVFNQTNINCFECHAISGGFLTEFYIHDLEFYPGGIDSKAIVGRGNDAVIDNINIIHNSYYGNDPRDTVVFRDDMYALVSLSTMAGTGGTNISNSRLLGSPQIAIWLDISGDYIPAPARHIYNNYISNNGKYTQNFGIQTTHINDLHIYNNTINHTLGRGIHLDGAGTVNNHIYNNTIIVRDSAHHGEMQRTTAYGIQMENGGGHSIHDNYIECRTHPIRGSCEDIRMSHTITNTDIFNNTLIAINENPELGNGFYAAVIYAIEYFSGTTHIRNNNMKTNSRFFYLYDTSGMNFTSNIMEILTPTINYDTYYFYGSSYLNLDNYAINNTEINEIDYTQVSYANSHSDEDSWFQVKWYVVVDAIQSGSPLNGITVNVYDDTGTLIESKQTGSYEDGSAIFEIVEMTHNYGVFQYPSSYYDVEVTNGLETHNFNNLNPDQSHYLTAFFGGGNPDLNQDSKTNIIDLAIAVFWQGKKNTDTDWEDYNHIDLLQDGKLNFLDILAMIGFI